MDVRGGCKGFRVSGLGFRGGAGNEVAALLRARTGGIVVETTRCIGAASLIPASKAQRCYPRKTPLASAAEHSRAAAPARHLSVRGSAPASAQPFDFKHASATIRCNRRYRYAIAQDDRARGREGGREGGEGGEIS